MKQLSAVLLAGTRGLASLPATAQMAPSPYHTRFVVDAPIIAGELAVSGFGLYRSMQRDGPTNTALAALNKNDIPRFDHFSAGYHSEGYQTASDFICYPSPAIAPGLPAFSPAIRSRKVAGRHGVSLVPLQGVNANGYAYSGLLLSKQP